MMNISVKVNGLFHVFNPKNEFIGIGLIQKRKCINRTDAACIKSKNEHMGKTEIVPLRSLKNDKHLFSSCDWILKNDLINKCNYYIFKIFLVSDSP